MSVSSPGIIQEEFSRRLEKLQVSYSSVSAALVQPVNTNQLKDAFSIMQYDQKLLELFRPVFEDVLYPYDFVPALRVVANAKRIAVKANRFLPKNEEYLIFSLPKIQTEEETRILKMISRLPKIPPQLEEIQPVTVEESVHVKIESKESLPPLTSDHVTQSEPAAVISILPAAEIKKFVSVPEKEGLKIVPVSVESEISVPLSVKIEEKESVLVEAEFAKTSVASVPALHLEEKETEENNFPVESDGISVPINVTSLSVSNENQNSSVSDKCVSSDRKIAPFLLPRKARKKIDNQPMFVKNSYNFAEFNMNSFLYPKHVKYKVIDFYCINPQRICADFLINKEQQVIEVEPG